MKRVSATIFHSMFNPVGFRRNVTMKRTIIKIELGFSCENDKSIKRLLKYFDNKMGKDIDALEGIELIPEHVRIGTAKEVFGNGGSSE